MGAHTPASAELDDSDLSIQRGILRDVRSEEPPIARGAADKQLTAPQLWVDTDAACASELQCDSDGSPMTQPALDHSFAVLRLGGMTRRKSSSSKMMRKIEILREFDDGGQRGIDALDLAISSY